MQEIVFDDSNTPHFRLRGDVTEDKTLEEAARKPMTIPDIPEVVSSGKNHPLTANINTLDFENGL